MGPHARRGECRRTAPAVAVGQGMRGHPVEDHTDAVAVEVIDQVHELLGRTIARGGREIAGGLVAPGAVERVLGDRQQFHVSEARLEHVGNQRVRDLPVAEEAPVLAPAPGAQVQLVDRLCRVQAVALAARRHPLLVAPGVVEAVHHRRGARRLLAADREGVRLVRHRGAGAGGDPVLVVCPAAQPAHPARSRNRRRAVRGGQRRRSSRSSRRPRRLRAHWAPRPRSARRRARRPGGSPAARAGARACPLGTGRRRDR